MCHQAHTSSAHAPILLDRIMVRASHHLRTIVQSLEIHMATLDTFHLIAYFRMEIQYRQITEIEQFDCWIEIKTIHKLLQFN